MPRSGEPSTDDGGTIGGDQGATGAPAEPPDRRENTGRHGQRQRSFHDRGIRVSRTQKEADVGNGFSYAVLCERWRIAGPLASVLRGQASNRPGAALAEDRRGERLGRRRGLISSGGDQEDVPESSGLGGCSGRASSFEASKPVEMTSKPRSGFVLGMSLAAARVAGQAVSGVEAA